MNTTPELTEKRLTGLKFVTDQYNKTKKQEFELNPDNKNLSYTPITEEEYIKDKVGKVLDSYWSQCFEDSVNDDSNWGLYIKALENKNNPEVALVIQKLKDIFGAS
jgi:hypothetical protein